MIALCEYERERAYLSSNIFYIFNFFFLISSETIESNLVALPVFVDSIDFKAP